jgi:DNA polymerase III epsilon subunit-like protein
MYLFFDTETTGLPLNWAAPAEDCNNWPRMVQAAWILHSDDGDEIPIRNYIIKPEGFEIPETAARIHGITTEIARKKGWPLLKVLQEFEEAVFKADFLVGHNISFDEKIMGAEFLRNGMKNCLEGKKMICTMKASTEYCAIENRFGYKWPKLAELHTQLFGTGFAAAHNAAADIEITAKCFWEMKRRGIL